MAYATEDGNYIRGLIAELTDRENPVEPLRALQCVTRVRDYIERWLPGQCPEMIATLDLVAEAAMLEIDGKGSAAEFMERFNVQADRCHVETLQRRSGALK